jgi:hypothetical protein
MQSRLARPYDTTIDQFNGNVLIGTYGAIEVYDPVASMLFCIV